MKFLTTLGICLLCLCSQAQDTTSVVAKKRDPNPKLASTLSAILPGAGQAYNRSFWKMPFIYAGIGAGIYLYSESRREFNVFRDSYITQYGDSDQVGSIPNPLAGQITSASYLLQEMETYRKRQEWAIIGIVGVYAIQIVEAAVDAHLASFDVSEDLSLNLSAAPIYAQGNMQPGIRLKLEFR